MASRLNGMESALSEVLRDGPLEIRPEEHAATVAGKTLHFTRHELGLLIALARRPGAVLGRVELADEAWRRPLQAGDRSVDVYVRRLRQKLQDAAPGWVFIHTHFAFGYRFNAEPSHAFHMVGTSR